MGQVHLSVQRFLRCDVPVHSDLLRRVGCYSTRPNHLGRAKIGRSKRWAEVDEWPPSLSQLAAYEVDASQNIPWAYSAREAERRLNMRRRRFAFCHFQRLGREI